MTAAEAIRRRVTQKLGMPGVSRPGPLAPPTVPPAVLGTAPTPGAIPGPVGDPQLIGGGLGSAPPPPAQWAPPNGPGVSTPHGLPTGLPTGDPSAFVPPMVPKGPPAGFTKLESGFNEDPPLPPDPTVPVDPTTPGSPMPDPETNPGVHLPTQEDVAKWYRDYLGREMKAEEYAYWVRNPDAEAGIRNSAEAKAWAAKQKPGAGSGDHGAFGKAWLASGGRTVADLDAFIKAHPEYGAEMFGSKRDKVRIGGRVFDAVLSAGAGGLGASWNDITDGEGGGGVPAEDPHAAALRQLLLDRLAKLGGEFDPNADPGVGASFNAASATAQREMDALRKTLAERLYAEGGGDVQGGELTQGIQQSREKTALGLSTLKADLIQQVIARRAQEYQDTLQLAIAQGDAAAARQMQQRLADLDAILRREGFGITLAEIMARYNQNAVPQ